jgi:hypothetical protein
MEEEDVALSEVGSEEDGDSALAMLRALGNRCISKDRMLIPRQMAVAQRRVVICAGSDRLAKAHETPWRLVFSAGKSVVEHGRNLGSWFDLINVHDWPASAAEPKSVPAPCRKGTR